MSKIFSPGIFISNSYARANMFIKKTLATEQFSITALGAAEDFLISPSNNKYLESFEYILDQKSKNSCEIKLKLIDIDGNLEDTILNSSALRNYLQDLSRSYSSDPTNTASNTPGLQSKISSQLKLYIAFGIGDDKNRWAGPYACVLTNATIDITGNGLRRIIYTFLPTNSYMFKSLVTTKAAPNTGITNKDYESDLAFSFIGQKASVELVVSSMGEYQNYDSNIRKLLLKYMDKVTGISNNTIVMLPNIGAANNYKELTINRDNLSWYNNFFPKFRNGEFGVGGGSRKIDRERLEDREFSEATQLNKELQAYSLFGIKTSNSGVVAPFWTPAQQQQAPVDAKDEISLASVGSNIRFPLTLILETPLVKDGSDEVVDWWKVLVEINRGYTRIERDSTVTITAWQESDIRILNFWKDQGIISNSKIPCTIVGGRELILKSLYANDNIIINSDSSSDQLQIDDPLYKKLNSLEYKIGIKEATNLVRPKDENSSFGETVAYDELAFDKDNPKSDKDKLLMEQYGELLQLPVFTNNLINSNILSLSLETGDTYAAVTRISVQSDASKSLADVIFGRFPTLNVEDVKKVNEIMAELNAIFNKQEDPDPRQDFQYTLDEFENPRRNNENNVYEKAFKEINLWLTDGDIDPQIDQRRIDHYRRTADIDLNFFGPTFPQKKSQKKLRNLKQFETIITNSKNQSLTLSGAMLVTRLLDAQVEGLFPSVKGSRLLDFVKLVTIANSAKPDNTNVVSNSIQGGPKLSSVASKIFDYMFRYAITLNIRTLPFFYLSGWKSLGTPTMVLSKRLGIVDSNSHTNIKNNFNNYDFFSGLYSIMGFRHIINSTECFSEFTLLKNNGGVEMIGGKNES